MDIKAGRWSITLIGLVGTLLMFAGARSVAAIGGIAAPSQDPLPDGPGKSTLVSICGKCHEPKRAASVRPTREGWKSTIDDMVARGAKGTDDEFAQILDYLATNFKGEGERPLSVN